MDRRIALIICFVSLLFFALIVNAQAMDQVRSAFKRYDYSLNLRPGNKDAVLKVTTGKNFVLTDIVTTPQGEPTPTSSCSNYPLTIFSNTTIKTVVYFCEYAYNPPIHFNSGISFSSGSKIYVQLPANPANIVLGITLSGYEYVPDPL